MEKRTRYRQEDTVNGLFKRKVKNTGMYRLIQWTWGLPQTLVGAILFVLNKNFQHFSYKGAIVTKWKSKSSVSLGMFLFVTDDPFFYYPKFQKDYDEDQFSKMLMVHEYGHTIQSLIFGPFYLFAVGVPSFAWSFLPVYVRKRADEGMSYFSVYPEKWANKLGEKVTGELSIGELV